MTARTSEHLAQALEAVGLVGLAGQARDDMFHDFLSPFALPGMALEARIRQARNACRDPILAKQYELVRERVINGEFDADKAEGDAWAASEDGQRVFRELFRK